VPHKSEPIAVPSLEGEMLQRLAAIEQQLAAVLAVVETFERSVDRQWSGAEALDREPVRLPASTPPDSVGAEFLATLVRRDQLRAAQLQRMSGAPWTSTTEEAMAVELDPLLDRLHALANELAERPASQAADLAIKAAAIREFCEEQSDDIVHRLAGSLAADILARRPPET
jgi:hypothetical protein